MILIIGIILAGVSVPHLIDDVLFGIPDEFGLTNLQAQVLAGVFSAPLIFIFNLVGRQKRAGIVGAGIVGAGFLGIFLVLAGILKHVPLMLQPGPYWSGLFSETLIFALFLSSLSLFGLSLYALLNNEA